MNILMRTRLSTMMFFQFFIWGAWFVTLGTYMGTMVIDNVNVFTGADIGEAYSTFAWAAIISPFFVGMIADKFFSVEKVLGICHLMGAGMMYWASTITDPATFFWVLLGYTLCYLPTIGLCNSVALEQMSDGEKEFPQVRLFGTIGWIVAGLVIGYLEVAASATPMLLAAGVSALMGVYSFSLPHIPPKSKGKKITIADVLCFEAFGLLKDRSFAIFVISSMLICIPLAFYYNFTNLFLDNMGMENATGKMTMGQMSEVAFLFILPFLYARMGVKTIFLMGMFAWTARYLLFAMGDNEDLVFMYYAGILLHGICYDFFFVAGYIYTDKIAPPHIRASAQGFIILATLGLGMLIGSYTSGYWVQVNTLYDAQTGTTVIGYDWFSIWAFPSAMALGVAVVFAVLFKNRSASSGAPNPSDQLKGESA